MYCDLGTSAGEISNLNKSGSKIASFFDIASDSDHSRNTILRRAAQRILHLGQVIHAFMGILRGLIQHVLHQGHAARLVIAILRDWTALKRTSQNVPSYA